MGVRAKFRCISKEERAFSAMHDETGEILEDCQVEVKLQPVYESGPTVSPKEHPTVLLGTNAVEENRMFGAATPAGVISMLLKNLAAADQFKAGQAYYVDFTPTEG